MNLFSISQLSQYSGIKAHTIRIWEQRYQALTPSRSEGNTRYYDNTQLRRILNISSLLNLGFKVSDVCKKSDEQLFKLVKDAKKNIVTDESQEFYISQLVSSSLTFNETLFNQTFEDYLNQNGLEKTYLNIIYPTLQRIGLLWATNNIPPAQEHFTSNLFRLKLFSAINELPEVQKNADKWLLFLPEDEFHELGLLFSYYQIKKAGKNAFYLGTNVPMVSLTEAVNDIDPEFLLFFLVHHNLPENVEKLISNLAKAFPDKIIIAVGNEEIKEDIQYSKSIIFLHHANDLEQLLHKNKKP